MKPTAIRAQAERIAERCRDAYSADRYASWPAVAQALLRAGYTERETETIMRSKITRWAADGHAARYGHAPAYIVAAFALDLFANHPEESLAEWVAATLPTTTDDDDEDDPR